MTLLDDGLGSILAQLRPTSATSRLESPADPLACLQDGIGSDRGVVVRVLEPSPPDRSAVDASATVPGLRAAARLDLALQRLLGEPACAPWRGHLPAAADWSWRLSDVLGESRTALLLPVANVAGHASLAWFAGSASATLHPRMAALLPGRSRRRGSRAVVESDVLCRVCDEPQYAAGTELQWIGSRGFDELQVAPVCAPCLGAAARDPLLWEQRRIRLASTGLRVIRGERIGHERSLDRDHLRILRDG